MHIYDDNKNTQRVIPLDDNASCTSIFTVPKIATRDMVMNYDRSFIQKKLDQIDPTLLPSLFLCFGSNSLEAQASIFHVIQLRELM